MYCPKCASDPCRYLPDEARTVDGYDRFKHEPGASRDRTREEVEAIFIHALLLGLDSIVLKDELALMPQTKLSESAG